MERIADNFAAIRAKLEEIEAAKVKARGDEPKPVETVYGQVVADMSAEPYVYTIGYHAPDDFMG